MNVLIVKLFQIYKKRTFWDSSKKILTVRYDF